LTGYNFTSEQLGDKSIIKYMYIISPTRNDNMKI